MVIINFKRDFGWIDCFDVPLNNISTIFDSMSRNLNDNEKNFSVIELRFSKNINLTEDQLTLNDDSFADITFKQFHGQKIKKMSLNAFGNASKTIKFFVCLNCEIQNQPPNYDIWKVLSQMTQLNEFVIKLNVSEIPSNALRPINEYVLNEFGFGSIQILTINSGAFQNLKNLTEINIFETKIQSFKNDSFKLHSNSDNKLQISISDSNLTGESFEFGAFNGLQRPVEIRFWKSDVNYISESTFKSVLNSQINTIDFFYPKSLGNSKIDCLNCKNEWLIKGGKEIQVKNTLCKENSNLTLFDEQIKNQLNSKCN